MNAKFKTALAAAALALIAGPAFAGEAHVFDGSEIMAKLAAHNAAVEASLAQKVLASADARLAPKFAAIETRAVTANALVAADLPALKVATLTAGR